VSIPPPHESSPFYWLWDEFNLDTTLHFIPVFKYTESGAFFRAYTPINGRLRGETAPPGLWYYPVEPEGQIGNPQDVQIW
jgi:hypothetical protein